MRNLPLCLEPGEEVSKEESGYRAGKISGETAVRGQFAVSSFFVAKVEFGEEGQKGCFGICDKREQESRKKGRTCECTSGILLWRVDTLGGGSSKR